MHTFPDPELLIPAWESWRSGTYPQPAALCLPASGQKDLIDKLQAIRFDPDLIQRLGALRGTDGRALFDESFLNYLQRFSFSCELATAPKGFQTCLQGPLIQLQILRPLLEQWTGEKWEWTDYRWPRPSLTVDCVIFGYDTGQALQALLIQRSNPPFEGQWALPGGFVDMDEDLQAAALRELEEETGMTDVFIEQLYTFGHPGRDPRGRVISVAYFSLINLSEHPVRAASDAKGVSWFPVNQLPQLAFDHAAIIQTALQRLRGKVRYQPIGFELLPGHFTLTHLQDLYEAVLDIPLNKRNFRTRILKMGVLEEVGMQEGVSHRPAKLYRFNQEKYQQMVSEKYTDLLRRGVNFEI